jgi:hypothetical protein
MSAPDSFRQHPTYCALLLGLWDGGIRLLGEVLVRLEYLSARHGGGVVMSGLRCFRGAMKLGGARGERRSRR